METRKHFDTAEKYMDAYASSMILTGPSGSGSVTKLANQIIVNNNIAIVSEALVFASKAGADPEKGIQGDSLWTCRQVPCWMQKPL